MKFQNLGFIFALEPVLKRIHKGEELKQAYLRHIEIFNTQPYMAGFVLGNAAGMEEKKIDGQQILKIKQSLACAYASIGDRIFWARLRISVFLATILLYFLLTVLQILPPVKAALFALAVPTALYCAFSIYIRAAGIKKGYLCSGSGYCGLDFLDWNKIIKVSSRANFAILVVIIFYGLFSAIVYRTGFSKDNDLFAFEFLFVITAVLAQRHFRAQKKPLTWTLFSCFAGALVFALLKRFFA